MSDQPGLGDRPDGRGIGAHYGPDPDNDPTGENPAYRDPAYRDPAYRDPTSRDPADPGSVYDEPAYRDPAYAGSADPYAYGDGVSDDDAYDDDLYDDGYDDTGYDDNGYDDGYRTTEVAGGSAHSRRRARRERRHPVLIGLAVLVVVVVIAAGGFVLWAKHQISPGGSPGPAVTVVIPNGSSTRQIGDILAHDGVIHSGTLFPYYVRLKGSGTLYPGTYRLVQERELRRRGRPPRSGPPIVQDRLVIPEGFTVAQMAAAVGKLPHAHITAAQFVAAADGGQVRSPFEPTKGTSLEGLLFPATYEVTAGAERQRPGAADGGCVRHQRGGGRPRRPGPPIWVHPLPGRDRRLHGRTRGQTDPGPGSDRQRDLQPAEGEHAAWHRLDPALRVAHRQSQGEPADAESLQHPAPYRPSAYAHRQPGTGLADRGAQAADDDLPVLRSHRTRRSDQLRLDAGTVRGDPKRVRARGLLLMRPGVGDRLT